MKKQRILSALLALCLVFSLVPTALAAGADDFTDVGKDSWCYDYVDYVTSEGYFLGTTDTTFSPNRNMTRAMFVVVLSRFDSVEVDNSQSSFTDVEPGAWCAGAIEWAAENGIVTGKGDGRFAPNDPITRAQMCAIMDRYVDYYTAKHGVVVAQKGTASTLADQSQVPAYAADAVRNCQIYGLINGYQDGSFRPQAYSTRAHVAAIIYRLAFLIDGAKDADKYVVCPDCGELVPKGELRCPSCGYKFSGGAGAQSSQTKPGSGRPSTEPDEPDEGRYTYQLTYKDTDGGFLRPTVKKTTDETSYRFPAYYPEKAGLTFVGWSLKPNGDVKYADGEQIELTKDRPELTVYAVWEPIPEEEITYKLIYKSADGTTEYDSPAPVTVAASSYTFDPYVLEDEETLKFVGWSKEENSKTAEYPTGEAITLTREGEETEVTLTVYAVFSGDLIGNAVQDAIEQARKEYIDPFNKNAAVENGQGTVLAKSTVDITDVDFTEENERNLTMTVRAYVDEELVTSILEEASEIALNMLPQFDPDEIDKEEVKSIVKEIVEAFEKATGIDISSGDIDIIKENVYNKLLEEGSSLWQNFNDGAGKYYTGNVTVSVEGVETATILVNESNKSNPTRLDGSKRTAVVKTAEAIADALYADLTQYTDYVSLVYMDSIVTLKFSAPANDYEEVTKNYPYTYNVKVRLNLNGRDLVQYKFVDGTGSYVKLVISEEIQSEYTETVDSVVKGALDNKSVQKKLNGQIDAAIQGFIKGTTFQSLIETMTEIEMEDPEGLVQAAMDAWKQSNYTGYSEANTLDKSPMYKLYWLEQDIDYDNTDVYELISSAAEAAGPYAADTMKQAIVEKLGENSLWMFDAICKSVTPENLEGTMLDYGIDLTSKLSNYPAAKNYILTTICDYLNGLENVKNNYANRAVYSAMTKEIDGMVKEKLQETSQIKTLMKARAIRTIADLENVEMGKAAEMLEKLTDKADIDLSEYDKYVEKAVNQIKRLPANVSVEVAGYELSKETLMNAFGGVETAEEFYDAMIELMNDHEDLKLADFTGEDGVPVTVAYNARTFTFYLVLEID